MEKILVDYSQIHLQENIPLHEEEINNIATQKKDFFKNTPASLLVALIIMVLIACYFLQNDFKNFKYYHYLLFIGIVLALYAFFYFLIWLTYKYYLRNWKKDIETGKNQLTSIVISRHKTENDEYMMTFAGRSQHEKIRLPAEKEDYYRYETGTKVVVSYLKYSKVILFIHELDT
ncbi:hypothetical protein MP477_21170 [Chryseobacterium sp. WG23]|uniref:hypothetical protein n=1 Tax=Chryseobacterium sp. WG23 TaxID=2926910 RepID=UPI00211E6C45|nr:hypothetical protein [Chryseobacterium sp. WG23]MCQ9637470.1 hypothetical protein [Chryseobacterium sp. WG23]